MKKLSVLSLVLLACGCTTLDTKVTWKQVGGDCVYIEESGETDYNILGEREFEVLASKEITYPDMQCRTIIDAELKNGTNKKQDTGIYRAHLGYTLRSN